jgi:hypothetical protein
MRRAAKTISVPLAGRLSLVFGPEDYSEMERSGRLTLKNIARPMEYIILYFPLVLVGMSEYKQQGLERHCSILICRLLIGLQKESI